MKGLSMLITQIEVRISLKQIFSLVILPTEEIGRYNFKGLDYVMSPLSYKASRNAESLRHSVKEYKKETKILKLNAGFI